MEVLKNNFAQMLPDFVSCINQCDFVAFDLEFSGLSMPTSERIKRYDSPAQRYALARESVTNFAPLQLGVCAFTRHGDGWLSRPFNFYSFANDERRFMCQASSIAFLAEHKFDFNKLFHSGIPFLSRDSEERERAEFNKRKDRKAAPRDLVVPTKKQDVEFLQKAEQQIAAWSGLTPLHPHEEKKGDASTAAAAAAASQQPPLKKARIDAPVGAGAGAGTSAASPAKPAAQAPAASPKDADGDAVMGGTSGTSGSGSSGSGVKASGGESVLLPTWSGFHRLLIYQLVERSFPSLFVEKVEEETKDASQQQPAQQATPGRAPPRAAFMRVRRMTQQEKEKAAADNAAASAAEFETKLKQQVGLRAVVDAIVAAKKPVVGHNMLLDLMHVCHSFLGPTFTPSSYAEFKRRLADLLPLVFDTKLIAESEQFRDRFRGGSSNSGAGGAGGGRPERKASAPGAAAPAASPAKLLLQSAQGDVLNMGGSGGPGASSVLGDLLRFTDSAEFKGDGKGGGAPVIELAEGFQRYKDTAFEHEAGYDAHLTGTLFARMLHAYKSAQPPAASAAAVSAFATPRAAEPLIPPAFVSALGNRVFLMASDAHMNFAGRDRYAEAFSSVFFVAAGSSGPELSFEQLSRAFEPFTAEAAVRAAGVAAASASASASAFAPASQQQQSQQQASGGHGVQPVSASVASAARPQPLDVSFVDPPWARKSAALVRLPTMSGGLDAAGIDRVIAHFAAQRPPPPFSVTSFAEYAAASAAMGVSALPPPATAAAATAASAPAAATAAGAPAVSAFGGAGAPSTPAKGGAGPASAFAPDTPTSAGMKRKRED